MGVFNTLGRQAEQLKQKFTSDPEYGCRACEQPVESGAEVCPHCGSDEIVTLR